MLEMSCMGIISLRSADSSQAIGSAPGDMHQVNVIADMGAYSTTKVTIEPQKKITSTQSDAFGRTITRGNFIQLRNE